MGYVESGASLFLATVVIVCLLLPALFVTHRLFKKNIVSPLTHILAMSKALAMGDISVNPKVLGEGEINHIGQSLHQAFDHQRKLYDFALKIGDGDYAADHVMAGEGDKLGQALTDMRNKLRKLSKEDAARNWTREGVALFSGILGAHSEDVVELSNEFIRQLVKYLQANQAALFLLERAEEEKAQSLQLVACYAWDRKKHLKKSLNWGEGLAWQAAMEKERIYISEVPEDFAKISSGLGEANPRSILIVPLLSKGELQGVIEVASFKVLEAHEITFVERIAENLATNLASTRTNEHTKKLLDESRKLTEHLQSQEEELRKNAEEQENLRESLQRAQHEMQVQIQQMEQERQKNIAILEGCVDGVMTFDSKGKIAFINKAAEEIWGLQRGEILGKNIHQFIPIHIEKQKEGFIANYVNGQVKEIDVRTEVLAHNATGEEMSVLLTVTKAQVGEEHSFTIFTQKISVELF